MSAARSSAIVAAFAALAGTLDEHSDVAGFAQAIVDAAPHLLGAASAGLVLAAADGDLEVLASTDDRRCLLDLLRILGDRLCLESCVSGDPIVLPDLRTAGTRWAAVRDRAAALGLAAAHCSPLRAGGITVGALVLLHSEPTAPTVDDLAVAHDLAAAAIDGVLRQRALGPIAVAEIRLRHVLGSRGVIEQAAGVLAETERIPVERAAEELLSVSAAGAMPLAVLARRIVDARAAGGTGGATGGRTGDRTGDRTGGAQDGAESSDDS